MNLPYDILPILYGISISIMEFWDIIWLGFVDIYI
jgi:hypothetical protein